MVPMVPDHHELFGCSVRMVYRDVDGAVSIDTVPEPAVESVAGCASQMRAYRGACDNVGVPVIPELPYPGAGPELVGEPVPGNVLLPRDIYQGIQPPNKGNVEYDRDCGRGVGQSCDEHYNLSWSGISVVHYKQSLADVCHIGHIAVCGIIQDEYPDRHLADNVYPGIDRVARHLSGMLHIRSACVSILQVPVRNGSDHLVPVVAGHSGIGNCSIIRGS